MMTASIMDDLRSFRRSWIHHTGMQLATLTVLVGTLSIVGFMLAFSLNAKRLLASWGDGMQLTVYLRDDLTDAKIQEVKAALSAQPEVTNVAYIARETATASFKTQMASYAPNLLADADFANPFPASFRLSLQGAMRGQDDVAKIETLAATLGKIDGVEDVSYGQNWIKTYSSFVSTIAAAGGVLIVVLMAGALFVIGNSIRASIATRREEIEILELVGATSSMIRRPYVAEGFCMGAVAAVFALILNFVLYTWQMSVVAKNFALGRLGDQLHFLGVFEALSFVAISALLGAFGAWVTIRKINDGWSASQGNAV